MISILTTDIELKVNAWEPALVAMTGLSYGQVYGRSLVELIPDFEARGLMPLFNRVLQSKQRIRLREHQIPYLFPAPPQPPIAHFDYMQQEVTIAPLHQRGEIVGIIISIEDITAQCEELQNVESILMPMAVTTKASAAPLDLAALIPDLQHQDWRIRQQAIAKLQNYGEPEIVENLVQLMRENHQNPDFLNAILQTLALTVVDPLPVLSRCLQDPDPDLRIYVALALGERRDPRAIQYLLAMLKDENLNVRFHSIEGLGRLKATEAIEPLLAIAQSEEFYLSFAALDALLMIGESAITPRLIPLIHSTLDWRVRREAIENLAINTDQALVIELLELMQRHHKNPSILNNILQVLALAEIDCLPFLRECLRDANPDIRIYTILALGARQDPQAIADLLPCLKDEDINVRFHACEALGTLQAIEAIPDLIEQAQAEDFFLAFPALEALIRIGTSEQGKTLGAIIAQDLIPLLANDALQEQAIAAMAQLGDLTVVEALSGVLNRSQAAVECVAQAIAAIANRYQQHTGESYLLVTAIARTVSPVGIQNLLAGLQQVHPENLEALVFVLGCLKGRAIEEALSTLLENPLVRDQVVEIFVGYGSRVVDLLLAQLDSHHIETRKAAITALGRIGSMQSVPILTHLLEAEHPELVMVTTDALAKIGDHHAFEALISLLGHPEIAVRLGAIAALNSLGHPQTAEKMLPLMDDENLNVRESAIKIVGYFAYANCLDKLLSKAHDPVENIRLVTIESLAYLDEADVLPILTQALWEDVPSVRAAAARALGELDSMAALSNLLDALEDQDSWVRYHSLKAIDKLIAPPLHKQPLTGEQQEEFQRRIFSLAQWDQSLPVRAAAIECLSNFSHHEVLSYLARLTEDTNEDIARATLKALGKMDDQRAIVPLLKCLNSPNPARRIDAIQAFREREEDAIDAQMTLEWMAIADPDHDVVEAAIKALLNLCTPESITALINLSIDPKNRNLCLTHLATYAQSCRLPKTDYIEAIAQSLNNEQSTVRRNVVEILKRLQHPHASAYLITALNDQDAVVRLAALEALIFLGNRDCQDQIRLLARTDQSLAVRHLARKGLNH